MKHYCWDCGNRIVWEGVDHNCPRTITRMEQAQKKLVETQRKILQKSICSKCKCEVVKEDSNENC